MRTHWPSAAPTLLHTIDAIMRTQVALDRDPVSTLEVRYEQGDVATVLEDPRVLFVLAFGADGVPPLLDDPRLIHRAFRSRDPQPTLEVWRVAGPVESGFEGPLRWASDGKLQYGSIAVDEAEAGGIEAAAEFAYRHLMDWTARSGFEGLLRIWNYADALTTGEGDSERYRLFNLGRARGIDRRLVRFPAGTAIGRCDGKRVLEVHWIASRVPGHAVENPRQVSAFHYPRQYGPQSPSFSRATVPAEPALPLFVSGTASVLGYESAHPGNLEAQLDEVLRNLASLIASARVARPELEASLGADSLLKVYVRDAEDLARVEAALSTRLPETAQRRVVHGEICRSELLVEIDLLHG